MNNSPEVSDLSTTEPRVGVVVPTLGTRNKYLLDCLSSIRRAGRCHIQLITATPNAHRHLLDSGQVDGMSEDEQMGLAAAINRGMSQLPASVTFATWLGDDDLLTDDSLTKARDALSGSGDAVMVFGSCEYIDEKGRTLVVIKSGQFAPWLLRIGPQLLPQPGSLFLLSAYRELGGLDTTLHGAFDLDLFIRLKKLGSRFIFIPVVLSKFRWHRESLSVQSRKTITREASTVRVRHLSPVLRALSFLWEPWVTWLILRASSLMTRRLHKVSRE